MLRLFNQLFFIQPQVVVLSTSRISTRTRRSLFLSLSSSSSSSSRAITSTATTTTTSQLPYPRAAVAVTVQAQKRKVVPNHDIVDEDEDANTVFDDKGKSSSNAYPNEKYYLLIQRANPPDQGKWSLPGGKIRIGESTMDAAKRELLEETNLSPHICEWFDHPFMTTDVIFARHPKENERKVHESNDKDILKLPKQQRDQKNKNSNDENVNDDSDDDEVPQSYEFHYVIAQCFATTDALHEIIPNDDALDAKWYTLKDIKEMEYNYHNSSDDDNDSKNYVGGEVSSLVVDVIQRAEELF